MRTPNKYVQLTRTRRRNFDKCTCFKVVTIFTEPHLVEAFQMANTAGLDEEELEFQFKRRDFIYFQKGAVEKARNEGQQEGRETEKREIAQKMWHDGMPLDIILKYTGLLEEEIQKLQQEG